MTSISSLRLKSRSVMGIADAGETGCSGMALIERSVSDQAWPAASSTRLSLSRAHRRFPRTDARPRLILRSFRTW
jgi:hypothetical protein